MRKGFSLIETIIALAIVLVTLTVFGVALGSLPLTKNARNQNLAYHIAAKKIEELRNTPFALLPPSGSFSDAGLTNLEAGTGTLSITNYEGASQIKDLVVIVSWLEGGAARNINLETLISENGLNK